MDSEEFPDLKSFIDKSDANKDQFEQFLVEEGLNSSLEFIWAVQGLETESHYLSQLIRTIHRTYFDILNISESVKLSVKSKIANREYSLDIFNEAVDEVWEFLGSVVYREFLNHVQTSDSSSVSLATASVGNEPPRPQSPPEPSVPKLNPSTSLEPLIEGEELRNQSNNNNNNATAPVVAAPHSAVVTLTKEALRATQKLRCTNFGVKTSGAMSLGFSKKPKFPYHYANYNSYNPVSRQDSEVQSFSSGCLTDSDSIKVKKKKQLSVNKICCDNLPNFQPTMHPPKPHEPKKSVLDEESFARILTEKLLALKHQRDAEAEEKMTKTRLNNEDFVTPKDLALALNKLHLDETKPDDILDKHVRRVWSDVTPDNSRSPPGRREYKRNKGTANPGLIRPRVHVKDQEHSNPLPKSRTFPSTSKYDHFDSGISIATTSTADEFGSTMWSNKPSVKWNPAKSKETKEISSVCVVFYKDNTVPFSFKIPTSEVTLSLFTDYLPKKGNYRYFFKNSGRDGVVWEEISSDDVEIPIFDGKIVCNLKNFQ